MSEGVIQFRLHHQPAAAASSTELATLSELRDALHARGGIGRDPTRYAGLAFGNVSGRLAGRSFRISATQTGEHRTLRESDWVTVVRAAPESNELWSEGPSLPSSESLTHAAIYASSQARFVAHVHLPALWHAALDGSVSLPATEPEATYGTPAMAAALARIAECSSLPFGAAMTGHEDGLMLAAASPESLLSLLDSLTEPLLRAR